jgi:TonB family protein
MKKLCIVFLLLCSLTVTGQKTFLDEYKASVVDSSRAKFYEMVYYGNSNKTFRKITYAISGEKESEFEFINSPNEVGTPYLWMLGAPDKKFIKNGISKSWNKNGQLLSQSNYVNGKQDGKSQTWYDDGKLKREMTFSNGQIEGKSLSWYNNGQLQSEATYVNGKIQGRSVSWYENGKIKSEYNYKNGGYNGDLLIYWQNGKLKRKDHYADNKFHDGACFDSLGIEIKHTPLESMPDYKGGDRKLLNDVANRIVYPLSAKNAGIQGRVVVVFAVDKNGEITDREIREGVNNELNLEAIRVVGTLKFLPGIQDGELVKVYYMLPVTFTLIR